MKKRTIKIIVLIIVLLIGGAILFTSLKTTDKSDRQMFPSNTLVTKDSGAFAFKNTTNQFETHFKSSVTNQDSVVFSNNLGKISFYTPKNQSFGEINSDISPFSSGSSVIYPKIFSQMDLSYTISSSRLLEEFIINNKETANIVTRIKQIADTKLNYNQNNDGSITFTNSKGETSFVIPAPVLYEKSDPTKKSYGIKYEVVKDNDSQLIISKVITPEGINWINDANRTYPIIIDLVIDNADTSSNWVSSDTTNTVVSQETTLKQEGTGSTKIQTTAQTNSTVDLMEYSSDTNAQSTYVSNYVGITATGGTISTYSAYTVHSFASSGTFTPSGSWTVDSLVVAGGGGGGGSNGAGGGGGAGGLIYTTGTSVTNQAYTVTVGTGGSGSGSTSGSGTKGNDSSFGSLVTATGGGGGGGYNGTNTTAAVSGGSGGGGGSSATGTFTGASGTSGQGYAGGNGLSTSTSANQSGGGGGGASATGTASTSTVAGNGGDGTSNSITGSSVTYAGGGGGGKRVSGTIGTGGAGGGGNGGLSTSGTAGTDGLGGGGGGGAGGGAGGDGGNGVVIISYLTSPILQSFSEGTIKTQGSYSLKVVAKATNSLSKTLTKTIVSPINLSGADSASFDIRSTRTGSNIKIGIHDSGGTTTEITPNITSADSFQTATIDLSGVSNANKDAINQIIITIVNADADNTFYIDNFTYLEGSLNDTVTLTSSAVDLSTYSNISFWVRSTQTGTFSRFQFGESTSNEQTYDITVNSANTWERKVWDISAITASSRNAVTKFAFTFPSDTSGATFYFDDIRTYAIPNVPSLDSPTDGGVNQSLTPQLKTTTTDPDSDNLKYKIVLCTDSGMSVNCQTFDQTSSQTGWSGQNADTSTTYTSGTQATYTVQSALSYSTTYYWKSYAIDPAGTNTWSSTQSSPYSFSTNYPPGTPTLDSPADTATDVSRTTDLKTTTTDQDSDNIQYKIILCKDSGMSVSCQTFDQTSSQTGWSGQNADSNTKYTSGTQGVYTIQTALDYTTTYYWKSYAIDPAGTNTWSSTQSTPYSFTTIGNDTPSLKCYIQESLKDTSLTVVWTDTSTSESGFELQRSVDGANYSVLQTLPANTTSYSDSTISDGHTYSYRVASYVTGPVYSTWCITQTLSLQLGTFSNQGIDLKGLILK